MFRHFRAFRIQWTARQNTGCSANDDGSVSETVVEMPEILLDLNVRSAEVTDVDRNCRNRTSDQAGSSATENVVEFREENESSVGTGKFEDNKNLEGERVCRICHLNSEQPLESDSSKGENDLIVLGCGCKGELSVAHSHCSEAWFKLKGNRNCEICGNMVTNTREAANEGFMEEWKERRSNGNATDLSERHQEEGCWHGQPLCNFLIAFLVIAFVIPWFFRINLW